MLRRSLIPLTVTFALLGPVFTPFTPLSQAQAADDTVRARALFQEGLQLEAGGNFAGALGKFEEVAQLKRTPQVLFHIALCQEKLGKLVAAVGGYRLVALEGGDDPKNAQVVQAAREALAGLEKKVPSLTIKRGKGADLAKILLDGVELGATTLDKPQQVDPGAHSLEATHPNKQPFKEVVKIGEGESKTIEVTLKDKPAAKEPPPDEPPPGETPPGPVKPPGDTVPKESSVVPYVVLGAGAASLVASGVFFYLRSSAISDLDGKCRGNLCPDSIKSTSDSGKSSTLLGNITLGLGVVGVGVGTVLLLTSGSSKEKSTAVLRPRSRSLDVVIHPGPQGGGASLVGTF